MGKCSTFGTRTSDRRLYDVRAVQRPAVLTTQPRSDFYSRMNFILMCFGNKVKTKEIQFLSFSTKIRTFSKRFLYHQLPNMMIHAHVKLAPLDFMNKNIIGKRRVFDPNRTSPFFVLPSLSLKMYCHISMMLLLFS